MSANVPVAAPESAASAVRPRLLSRALVLVFLASFGAMASFYLLLSVVPLYAAEGGGGRLQSGLTTGVLMLATVSAELATPWLIGRFGYRLTFAAGLLVLGAPALALIASDALPLILAVCAVRGFGFAIVVVVGAALVASLVPRERRGEGLGLLGVVVGIPGVSALPLGVWLADQVGYRPVFVAAAASSLVVVPAAAAIRVPRASRDGAGGGVLAGLRGAALRGPAVIFATTAMAAGAIVTFLPLAITGASGVAALGLLVQAGTATASRWWAGRRGDRHGALALLAPGVFVAAVGMLALVLVAHPVAVVIAMALFGAGFGVSQNASLSVMLDRVEPSGYGLVSALWNLAYDAGMGLGAIGFGAVAGATGYPAGFAVCAAIIAATLAATRWRQSAGSRHPSAAASVPARS